MKEQKQKGEKMIITMEELKLALRDKKMDHCKLPDKLLNYKIAYRQSLETIACDRWVLLALRKEIQKINLEETADIVEILKKIMSMLSDRLWVGNSALTLKEQNGDLASICRLEGLLPFLGVSINDLVDMGLRTHSELVKMRGNDT
ncbi:MAG: hypothetical protein KAH54_09700 [Candidatus Sabulitectum sp.]|nr:hypothetical protein [Candidatus Sabulitectum sp.]